MSSGRHPEHRRDSKTADVLQRLLHANVTLNVERCTFSQNKVQFLGQVVGKDGVEVDPSKVEVISELKAPTDVSQLRRFQGMIWNSHWEVCQITTADGCGAWPSSKHLTRLSKRSAKLQHWQYTTPQEQPKSRLMHHHLDWERSWCNQPHMDTGKQLQCYAQVEKQAVAVTWACERLSDYVIGKTFHKPLVSLIGCKNLNELPPRIHRLCMRLLWFKYTISKSLVVANTSSQAPVTKHKSEHDDRQNEEIELYGNSVLSEIPASDKCLEEKERMKCVDK